MRFSEASLVQLFEDDARPKLSEAPILGFTSPRLLALARLFEMECCDNAISGPLFGDSLSISLISLLAGVGPLSRPRSTGGLTARQLKAVTDILTPTWRGRSILQPWRSLSGCPRRIFTGPSKPLPAYRLTPG